MHTDKPATGADTNAPAKPDSSNPFKWIDQHRVAGIPAEIKTARNPFVDILAPTIVKPNGDNPGTIPPGDQRLPKTPGGGPLTVPPPPPPPPAFILRGVMVWDHISAATIALEGEGYSTFHVGEAVFNTGWTVKSISPEYNQVTLIKSGYQPVSLRQGGGSQK